MASPVDFNTSNIYLGTHKKKNWVNKPKFAPESKKQETVAFGNLFNFFSHPILSVSTLRKLKTQQDKDNYILLHNALDYQGQADLKFLLDTGKLLSTDADDHTSTLHNLVRILKEPKAKLHHIEGFNSNKDLSFKGNGNGSHIDGLDAVDILTSCVRNLANPYGITQDFGELTEDVAQHILEDERYNAIANSFGLPDPRNKNNQPANRQKMPNAAFSAKETKGLNLPDLKTQVFPETRPKNQQPSKSSALAMLPAGYRVTASGDCVAASRDGSLADKRPSEYARYAADVTSPKMAILEDFKFSDISDNTMEAMYWLDQFNIEYNADNFEGGKAVIRPDKNAIYRAIAQTQNRQPGSRSALDTLLQSAFMQFGSAASYNSLNDIRTGGFNLTNRGLTEFEKSMLEAITDDGGGVSSVTYQNVDDKAYLVGYNKDYDETLMDIVNSLKTGTDVIVGITETDKNAKIMGGHEITVTASKVTPDGKLSFVCNDTDDNIDEPVEMDAEELIPKIHHAGIPNVVLKNKPEYQQKPEREIIIQIPPSLDAKLATASVDTTFFNNDSTKELKKKLNIAA